MNYYAIERSDDLEHGEWGKKATKYIKKVLVNGKWRYIYKDATSKAKYAVNRVKKGAEEAVNKVKNNINEKINDYKAEKRKDTHTAQRMADDIASGRRTYDLEKLGKWKTIHKQNVSGKFIKPIWKDGKYSTTYSHYTDIDSYNPEIGKRTVESRLINKALKSEEKRRKKKKKG